MTIKQVCYLKEGVSVSGSDLQNRYPTQCGKRRTNVTISKQSVTCPSCQKLIKR